jgi:hypothetical protein
LDWALIPQFACQLGRDEIGMDVVKGRTKFETVSAPLRLHFSGETATVSATATPKPFISEQKLEPNLDRQWFQGIMARWNIADEFVRFLDPEALPKDHALRQFVGMDVPQLIAELARFRPDLFPRGPDAGARSSFPWLKGVR